MQHVMIIDSVDKLKRNYTKKLDRVEKARRMYVTLESPSEDVFESTMKKGKILNNPVTITDYKNALEIYGKDL
jgi:phosphoribosylformylglycinamidine (FGAM) synthase PurS component